MLAIALIASLLFRAGKKKEERALDSTRGYSAKCLAGRGLGPAIYLLWPWIINRSSLSERYVHSIVLGLIGRGGSISLVTWAILPLPELTRTKQHAVSVVDSLVSRLCSR